MINNRLKILVTGANGFIGSALCKTLITQGYSVIGAIRKQTPHFNIPVKIIGNINQKTDWTNALIDVDIVIHLAARVHIMQETSTNARDLYREVNVFGTTNLAEQAIKAGVKRFIFASSIKVLGAERDTPYTHQDSPNPSDDYAHSKWEAEQALQQQLQHQAVELVILRFPLVYGQGVKANFLRLIQCVDKGIPLPLKAVKNKRSLIYLGNLLDAIQTCCQHPKAANETFLISDGTDLSSAELIQRIAHHLHTSARLFSLPPQGLKGLLTLLGKQAEAKRLLGSLQINNAHLCTTLNWHPPYTIDEGLAQTLVDYKKS